MDGTEVPDVNYISITKSPYYDNMPEDTDPEEVYGLSIHTCDDSEIDAEGMATHTSIVANKNGDLEYSDGKQSNRTKLSEFCKKLLKSRRS